MKCSEKEGSATVYPFSNRFSYSAGSVPQSVQGVPGLANEHSFLQDAGGVVSGIGQDLHTCPVYSMVTCPRMFSEGRRVEISLPDSTSVLT